VGQAKRVQNRTSVLWFDIKNGSSESLMCGSGGASLGGPAGPLPFPPPKKKNNRIPAILPIKKGVVDLS